MADCCGGCRFWCGRCLRLHKLKLASSEPCDEYGVRLANS
jgi:hypothetical protein